MAKQEVEVLSRLDHAKTQYYHFTAIIIAGMGFFTDAYDLFCISTVTKLLGRLYYYDPDTGVPGVLPPVVYASVNGVALVGTLFGQLLFGWLGDKLGRKRVYGITLWIMVVSSIASSLSFGHTAKSVMATLCFFRFWLGVGIGGDYPLSATIMSEYANTRTRGAFIAAVFAMQGFGILFGGTVAIIVSSAFRNSTHPPYFLQDQILSTPPETDFIWRIIFAIGAIPAALTYYWRMKMPETARYTALVEGNLKKANQDMARVLQVEFEPATASSRSEGRKIEQYGLWSSEFARRQGLRLLGTTVCWFTLDVAYYSQNLFQKDVLTAVGWLPQPKFLSAAEEVYRVAKAQAILACLSTVPGYWFTVFFIDRIGRFTIQLMGFFFMTAFMFSAAIPYRQLRGDPCVDDPSRYCGGRKNLFIFLYGLTFFFSNFGPNSTTFIVPAELFPARLRSTCHGLSAAAGKLGAIVGSFGFQYASEDKHHPDPGYNRGLGTRTALLILACCNAIGFLFTFLVPETNQRSLEDLSGENEEMGIAASAPASNSGTSSSDFQSLPRAEALEDL